MNIDTMTPAELTAAIVRLRHSATLLLHKSLPLTTPTHAVWYQQLAIHRLEAAAELCLVKRAAVRARLAGNIESAVNKEARFERLASDFSTRWINETARAKAVSMARALGIV